LFPNNLNGDFPRLLQNLNVSKQTNINVAKAADTREENLKQKIFFIY